ncbi:MAG: T9SS type A sorting domain-containing protein, partial [Ignavibacteriaceae bacterium]
SFYVDDKDKDGIPDKDGIWNSYYVNAGDTAWWEFNRPLADDVLAVHECDGLFLDLVDTGGPNSWGLPYQWTAEGMIKYIEYLRETYSGKYILGNRGIFYFDPALAAHYAYSDRYRKSIDGLMIESYYAKWDWNQSVGIYNTGFPYLRDHFAPLLNIQANKQDGFDIFILDYLKLNQQNYSSLLDTVVKVTERDQGWLISVTTIYLDSIRSDTYHHHQTDINPPTWTNIVGISKYKWNGDDLELYWDKAVDQTLPVKYHLYISDSEIDFSSPPQHPNLTPQSSDISDFKFIVHGLDKTKIYKAALRASDSSAPENTDPNRRIVEILPGENNQILIDGYFDDWSISNQVDYNDRTELEGDTIVSKSCDLIDVWFAEDEDNFYFSFSAGGPVLAPPYYYHVFIDEDNNPQTGYHSNNSFIGIDIMCENGYLWRYTGTDNTWSWEYLEQIDYMVGLNNSNQVELAIPRTLLSGNSQSISFIYHIDNSDASVDDDYSPNNYTQDFYSSNIVSVNEIQQQLPHSLEVTHYTYPNPFNSAVTFSGSFNRPVNGEIEIMIYDITGSLIHSHIIAGAGQTEFQYSWEVNNSGKRELPSGIYLFRISGKKERLFSYGKIVYLK